MLPMRKSTLYDIGLERETFVILRKTAKDYSMYKAYASLRFVSRDMTIA